MKDKLKSILSNGLPYGLVFFGLSFVLGYYSFNIDLQKSLQMSVFIGLAALLANGLIFNRFSKPLKKLEEISIKCNELEKVLIQAPANHLIQDSLVPGKLFLTNQRLIFKTYGTDENQSLIYAWDVHHIKPIGFYGSIRNSGGEFLLKTEDNVSLMFEVNELKLWKEAFRNE